mmetsp:Transcript_13113/g.18121  ORF Transcript_13113/g.18121 Transcript_13113/m.18121 type:complete len:130 (+) Transcript_13113:496-885(+)
MLSVSTQVSPTTSITGSPYGHPSGPANKNSSRSEIRVAGSVTNPADEGENIVQLEPFVTKLQDLQESMNQINVKLDNLTRGLSKASSSSERDQPFTRDLLIAAQDLDRIAWNSRRIDRLFDNEDDQGGD